MKILILSSNSKPANGAISYQMLQDFKNQGHQVKIVTNFSEENHDDIITYSYNIKNNLGIIFRRLKIMSSGIFRRPVVNKKYYFQDIYETVTFNNSKTLLKKANFIPDVIFLHFNNHFINAKNLYQLNKLTNAPVFILLMDMAPMTGGCHYAWDCERYKKECGLCPGLFSKKVEDLSRKNFYFRKKYFDKTNIQIVAASDWQYKQCKESALLKGKPLYKILTGFNPEIFKPSDKTYIREQIGIPINKKVIFFGASIIEEERKGIHLLLKALMILEKRFSQDALYLLIAGNATNDFLKKLKISYKYLGFLDEQGLASAYQAADVFACPSLEDSGPTMINQSLLCGTPVVCFKMGVAPDLIRNSENGFITNRGDSDEFATYVERILILDTHEATIISNTCRETGLEKCNSELQIPKYLELLKRSITNE
jgi:glycosyltransferase involved in cell wall biosynthesis